MTNNFFSIFFKFSKGETYKWVYELSEPVVLNKQVDCHCEQKKNADAEEKNEAPQGLHKTMSVVAMENVQKNDSKLTKVN